MLYRRFGRTHLQMPVFSCGGMRFQQSWQDVPDEDIDPDSQANLEAVVHRALDAGINHIETARGYGASEVQLGRILPRLPRDQMIVQTKVGVNANGKEFRRDFERSLATLKLDYIDLLALHGVNNREIWQAARRKNGPLSVLKQARTDGRIGHIGFSTHGPRELIVEAIESDEFDYVNLHWYYVDQSNLAAIEAASRHDMGVFIISPSDKGGKLYAPPAKLVELCAPFSPIGFNDLFCLANPQVHTLSVGAARPAEFDPHLEILPHVERAAEAIAPVVARLESEARRALGDRWIERWPEGLPVWEEASGNANLYHILRLYGLWKSFDMLEYARARYNLLGNGGHWFPGSKVDAIDWQGFPETVRKSPFAERLPKILRECHAAFNQADEKRLSESD